MKRYFAAAGALLLGTSTVAIAADVKMSDMSGSDPAKVASETKLVETTAGKPVAEAKLAAGTDFAAKQVATGSDKALLAAKSYSAPTADAKVQTAAFDKGFDKAGLPDADTKLRLASADAVEPKLALTDKAETGMGGPLEADAVPTAALTPQPATQNYPPCEPGPGDDRCIQLYEEGVREQLASWNRPTGGLLGNEPDSAMGGPFEPVEAKPAEQSGKVHSTDASVGSEWKPVYAESELAKEESASADPAVPSDAGGHDAFTGVGGPVEAQSGYPPCEPGPGDDRCIQLYEAGITGAGN